MSRELLVLGVLLNSDMHGYKLHEFISGQMSYYSDMKRGTLYALLDKLKKKGWISEHEEREGNSPPRKIHAITDDGKVAYFKLLRENLRNHNHPIFVDDIGIAFVDKLEPEESIALLQERRTQIEALLAGFHQLESLHKGSTILAVNHQIHFLESELSWLDKIIKWIQKR